MGIETLILPLKLSMFLELLLAIWVLKQQKLSLRLQSLEMVTRYMGIETPPYIKEKINEKTWLLAIWVLKHLSLLGIA